MSLVRAAPTGVLLPPLVLVSQRFGRQSNFLKPKLANHGPALDKRAGQCISDKLSERLRNGQALFRHVLIHVIHIFQDLHDKVLAFPEILSLV
jgi:hypothetical protein